MPCSRSLPADSVRDLSVGCVVPGSFAAVAHLAPGLRSLGVYLDNLGDDAPSVIAELTALQSLALYGDSAMDEGQRLGDHALSVIAGLPALEYLALLDVAYRAGPAAAGPPAEAAAPPHRKGRPDGPDVPVRRRHAGAH